MREFILAYDFTTLDGFTAWVMEDILSELEGNPYFVEQVLNFGVSSGIATSIIYTHDCKKIFSEFMDDLFDIYNEVKQDICVDIEVNPTTLVWLGYEYVCSIIYNEFQMVAD